MAEFGWTGTGHGGDQLYEVDVETGRTEALDASESVIPGASMREGEQFMDAVRRDPELQSELNALGAPPTEPLDGEASWPEP